MNYWVDWNNCCIVFGFFENNTFKDLSGATYLKYVNPKDVFSDLKEAESYLISHFKNV